jgi:hypothetical protein
MNTTTFTLAGHGETIQVEGAWEDVPVFSEINTDDEDVSAMLSEDVHQWTPIGRMRERRHYWWVHTALQAYANANSMNMEVSNPPSDDLLNPSGNNDYPDEVVF